MNIKNQILTRVYVAFFIICLLGLCVIVKTVKIQRFEGDHWLSMAKELTTSYKNIEAVRGNIYAENGMLMATSLPIYEVRMDVNSNALDEDVFTEKIDSLAYCLSNFFNDKSPGEYSRELITARKNGERYHLIRKKISYPQLKVMKTWPLFRMGRFKGGFIVEQKNKRVKPFKALAARTIGYVREGIQPVGIEGAFDEHLAGVGGKRLMQRISGGIWMPINDENEIDPQDGKDILTTININLQDVAEQALLEQLVKYRADHGCVVLMEVKTGEIKAVANLGCDSIGGGFYEKYNYAIGEATEPGSTFKLASIMAALEDGYIKTSDTIDVEKGRKQYYDKVLKDDKEGKYDKITIKKAFEISSNVGLSKIVNENYAKNPQAFIDHLKRFHLDQKTGIPIAGEGEPYIRDPGSTNWSGITLPWMSIGYEVKLTPLQILTFYNTIANNGKMVKPLLVKEIRSRGEVIKSFETEVIDEAICSKEVIDQVKPLLEGVVENGTAANLKTSSYKIAGKTGTAKIADQVHGYKKNVTYQASFVGYFPAQNPKYSCIVVIKGPSNRIFYGNLVAGPIFKEIAEKIFAMDVDMHELIVSSKEEDGKKIPYAKAGNKSDVKLVYNELGIPIQDSNESNWIITRKTRDSIEFVERVIIPNLVPNVIGMGLKDALYLLENSGLIVEVKGYGKVRKQSLKIGSRIIKGKDIKIDLS